MVTYRAVTNAIHGGNYWHIVDARWSGDRKAELQGELDHRNVPYKASAARPRLVELNERLERGLYCGYDGCTNRELAAFLKQRGGRTTPRTPKREVLISTLEKMDEDATFHKFEDLPAEIRLRIYAAHFDWIASNKKDDEDLTDDVQDYECTLDFPNPPPITQVNKLLRQEALPLFFQTFVFELYVAWHHVATDRGADPFYNNSDSFLKIISDENFAMIRNLILDTTVGLPADVSERASLTHLSLRISIGSGQKASTCSIEESGAVQNIWRYVVLEHWP